MWRSSGKLTSSSRLSARQFSSFKQNYLSGGSIHGKVVPKSTTQSSFRNLSTSTSGGKASAGSKVVIGAAVLTGTVAGGLYYVNNNESFRRTVEEKLPFSATLFNAVIGKSKSDTNLRQPAISSSQDRESSENQLFSKDADKEIEPLPFAQDPVLPSEIPETEEEKPSKELVSEKKLKGKPEASAAVSSVDQMAVSSVDLDISKTVEKEVSESDTESSSIEIEPESTTTSDKQKKEKKEDDDESGGSGKGGSVQDEKLEMRESDEITKEPEVSENTTSKAATTSLEIALQTALATASQLGEKAIECYDIAIDAVRHHRQSVVEALEKAENDTISKDYWETLGSLSQTKSNALKEVETKTSQLDEMIDKIQMIISEGKEKGLGATVEVAAETLAKLRYALQQAKNHLKEIQNEGSVLKQLQDYVEEGKQHLREQLASIRHEFPDSKHDEKSDEALLAYAQNRIRLLEDALEKRETEERKVIEKALTKQQKENEKLAEMRLKHELDELKNELKSQMKQKEASMIEEHESDIRQQLRRQAAVFGDHLNDVLKVQANELDEKHQGEKREQLLLQRQEFELKLCGALARLNGVMAALQSRADIEKANSEAQELWLACQSLSTAIAGLGDDRPRLYPVRSEVEKIRRITKHNEIVGAILDSLPEEVLHRGVFPEESLRRRFPLVRKACKQVAMVGEEGGGVWSYLLSYFQSLLVFDVHAAKKLEPIDPEELDTHTILSLAASSLEEGDTEQAVRYMNQLSGEPRRVARDWVQEGRLFLETRQVARFLTSFASAYNIGAGQ